MKDFRAEYEELKKIADKFEKEQRLEYMSRYGARLEFLLSKAKSTCDHQKTEVHRWHHGYGEYVNGERCTFCGKYRAWSGMGEWKNEIPFMRFED